MKRIVCAAIALGLMGSSALAGGKGYQPVHSSPPTYIYKPSVNVNASAKANASATPKSYSNSAATANVVNSVAVSAGSAGGPLGMIAGSVIGALLVQGINANQQQTVVAERPRRAYKPQPVIHYHYHMQCGCPTDGVPLPPK